MCLQPTHAGPPLVFKIPKPLLFANFITHISCWFWNFCEHIIWLVSDCVETINLASWQWINKFVGILQARAILLLASREMEEKTRTPTASDATSPSLHSQLYSATGLSMKRSLQRFLQKRKNRMEATPPYHR